MDCCVPDSADFDSNSVLSGSSQPYHDVPLHDFMNSGNSVYECRRLYGTSKQTETKDERANAPHRLDSSELDYCTSKYIAEETKTSSEHSNDAGLHTSEDGERKVDISINDSQHIQSLQKRRTRTDKARLLANQRETIRTTNINHGFNSLRNILPKSCAPIGTKQLSRISTIMAAIEYIGYLGNVLEYGEDKCDFRLNRKYQKHIQLISNLPTSDDVQTLKSDVSSFVAKDRKIVKVRRRCASSKELSPISSTTSARNLPRKSTQGR